MNIEIKREVPYDDRSDYIKWDLDKKPVYKFIVYSFLAGAVLIAIYFCNNDFTILEPLGSFLIILSVMGLFGVLRSKNDFNHRYQKTRKYPKESALKSASQYRIPCLNTKHLK